MLSPSYGLALETHVSNAEELALAYGKWEGICSNHIVNADGEFYGPDGSSRSISTTQDRELLIRLRALADLVVVDARTARSEKYKMPSSGAALAIFSATGNFEGIPALGQPSSNCFLFGPDISLETAGHNFEAIRSPGNPLLGLAAWASQRGLPAVLLEAGPTLSRTAFGNRLVTHSAVTITLEKLESKALTGMHPFDRSARLVSVAHGAGATFTYWSH